MNKEQKTAILEYIKLHDPAGQVIRLIKPSNDLNSGSIQYNSNTIVLHREVSLLTDEEYVRAYLVVRLVKELGYSTAKSIELEKTYSIGRPSKKSARVDVLVKFPNDWSVPNERSTTFLFIECKAPAKFDSDKDYLKGQLFDLAKQEEPDPRFAVYYTTIFSNSTLQDRSLIISLSRFSNWADWDNEGQPSNSILPERYGVPRNIEYANVLQPTVANRPLRTDVTRGEFDRLRKDLHDVIWGGGGTNNNDVFVILIRLFLCRVFDELETPPDGRYRFQRVAYENGEVESADDVREAMTVLFKEAARTYLGYSDRELEETTPFESKKVSAAKIAFVVEQLQGISLTRNTHRGEGDLLGDFFEGIVSQDFTQTKGQFFTHVNLVKFCIELCDFANAVRTTFLNERDSQGRPRIPKVIDPSCGSGTFLIEAMKAGTSALTPTKSDKLLPRRLKEYASLWFSDESPNSWAREFIYGVETNADLGLATKVNMILHGDGSTNVFVNTGLAAFEQFALSDRSHGLAIKKKKSSDYPYPHDCNEEFDFIFTNPPFSISLSADEKRSLQNSFALDAESASEHLFVERWFQLLRQGGRVVAIVPETILDSASSADVRTFLLKYFRIRAVVSLPYIAFKPFTSTKTCIIYAEKKADADVMEWENAWNAATRQFKSHFKDYKSPESSKKAAGARALLMLDDASIDAQAGFLARYEQEIDYIARDANSWILRKALDSKSIDNYELFLAEPQHVGYKRRKGLPDLHQENDLLPTEGGPSVLSSLRGGGNETLRYGFRVRLSDLCARPGIRMDPKFVHLWVKQSGTIFESRSEQVALRDLLIPHKPTKLAKGPLEEPRILVDLANVEARMSTASDLQEVEEIGSDKIEFGDAELAISKLEPYLGKVLAIKEEERWIGSPEWLTYKTSDRVESLDYIRFLLLTPEMLEVYRCLQSGKRHARMSEADFLSLRVPLAPSGTQAEVAERCVGKMNTILNKRSEIQKLRGEIDAEIVKNLRGDTRLKH
jgi:type I restriction enzyme M protein